MTKYSDTSVTWDLDPEDLNKTAGILFIKVIDVKVRCVGFLSKWNTALSQIMYKCENGGGRWVVSKRGIYRQQCCIKSLSLIFDAFVLLCYSMILVIVADQI